MEIKTRNYKLDALKMCLIVLVIFGHIPLLDGFIDLYLPGNYDYMTMHAMKGIYAFHMPLFVMLSGYFTRQKTLGVQFFKSLKLLRLFVVFQIIDIFIKSVLLGETFCWLDALYPCFALWYLLCLFYWRMLLSIIPQKWNPKCIVAISFFISIAIGFIKIDGIMGLHRFFSFMPYFMIGHYYGEQILKYSEGKKAYTCYRKIIIIVMFLVLMGFVSLNPYWLDCIIQPYGSLKMSVIRFAYLCYSLLLCYMLFCIFNFKHDWNGSTLSKLGCETLFFYLLHPYVLYVITIFIVGPGGKINIFDSIMITVFTVVVLLLMGKIKIIHLLIE